MDKHEFDRLLASIKEMKHIRAGKIKPAKVHRFDPVEVKGIRSKLKLSQAEFAALLGISDATLKNWEQGRVEPDGPAKVLLKVVARQPKAVMAALHG